MRNLLRSKGFGDDELEATLAQADGMAAGIKSFTDMHFGVTAKVPTAASTAKARQVFGISELVEQIMLNLIPQEVVVA